MGRRWWVRIGGIALAILVLGVVSVGAVEYGTLYLDNQGTAADATWSTTQVKFDTYSASLVGGTDGGTGTSYGRVWKPVNIALADIAGISFWYYLSSTAQADISAWPVYKQEVQTYSDNTVFMTPYVVLEITDGANTHWIISQPFSRDPDGGWTAAWEQWDMSNNAAPSGGHDPTQALWHNEAFTDDVGTGGAGAYPAGWEYLGYFKTLYAGYEVIKFKIVMGDWAIATNQSAYVDDFAVDASVTTYGIEPRVFIGATPYGAIQAAVDAASAGDTITCADGTFQESISVTTANLTLQSQNGRDHTTVINTGNLTNPPFPEAATCGFLIRGSADNFTLGGAADEGFTFSGGTSPRLIQLNNGPSGVEISHNAIDTSGVAGTGVSIGAAGASGLIVSYNNFTADSADVSVAGMGTTMAIVNLTITHNDFAGPGILGTWTEAIGVGGITATSPSRISGNTIADFDKAINIETGTGTSDLLISNNTVSDSDIGICLKESGSGDMTTVSVIGNTLQNNNTGLQVEDGTPVKCDQFTVKLNNFVGNTTGLNNLHATLDVTAKDNWWNSDSGPTHAGNPGGAGDPVSDKVTYDPWLESTVEGTVTVTVTAGGTLDAQAELGLEVDVVGAAADVTVSTYTDNPGGAGFGTNAGFFDVFVPDVTGVTEIRVRFYYPDTIGPPDEANLKASYWDGTNWVECSNQTLNTTNIVGPPAYGGFIEVTITTTTIPTLNDLTGTIFGSGWTLPASVFWYEDFEYANQAAMETAGWVFGTNAEQLWHLTSEAAVPSLAYPNLVAFPSSDNAVWFANPNQGSYGSSVAPLSVSPEVRGQRTRIQPMGAGQGYPYGELTSPDIDVSGQTSVKVSFDYFREVECYYQGTYDKTYAQVQFDGGPWQTVWSRDSQDCWESEIGVWIPASVDGVPVYEEYWIPVGVPSGATNMKIRFVFDAVDNVANDFLGWLIDDLKVSSAGPAGLRFEEEALPEGLVGQAYSATIHAVGGTASETYAWRVISNSASSWLTIHTGTTTASLSGTPTAAGTYQLCIGVSDDRGETYSDCYDIVVEQMISGGELFYDDFETVPDPNWTTTGLWHRTQNTPCVSPPYASPTHVYYYGKDATCNYATAGANSGILTSPSITAPEGAILTIGWKYWRQVESYNGDYDKTWVEYKFDTGSWTQIWYDDSKQTQLQNGWHLVEVKGITVPSGATSLQIRFQFDTVDGYANNFVGWLIDDVKVILQTDLAITTTCVELSGGKVGEGYSHTLSATGGKPPYTTWLMTAGSIPGLTFASGVLSGNPTTAGTYPCTFTVTDSASNTASLSCDIIIAGDCPCALLEEHFSTCTSWTKTGLWHCVANPCVCCSCSPFLDPSNVLAYFGIDSTCTYNNGSTVFGYLLSPTIPVDSCVDDVALQFSHCRWVEEYSAAYDQTYIQISWTSTTGPWTTIWYRDAQNPSPDCETIRISPIPRGGTQLWVRFVFDSVDSLFQNFCGWFIDDIYVSNADSGCLASLPTPDTQVGPMAKLEPKAVARDQQISVLNVPNPVRDVHTTKFTVRGIGIEAIKIQIFSLDETMVFEQEAAGNELEWHTVNDYGEYVANGIYFYRALVKMGGKWISTGFQKLVILR